MPAKSCRSLVDKQESAMQTDFTSPKCENLVIKWSNKQDVAHNALKKTVAKLVWRGKFIHTYKETEEYLFSTRIFTGWLPHLSRSVTLTT